MSTRNLPRRWGLAGFVTLATLFACTVDKTIAPRRGVPNDGALRDVGPPQPGQIMVCEKGGPAGNYNFQVTLAGGGDWTLLAAPNVSIPFDGTTMTCLEASTQTNPASWPTGTTSNVTVTATVPPGMKVDSIQIYNALTGQFETPTPTNTNTASRAVGFSDNIWFKFFESPTTTTPPTANCVTITAVQGTPITPVTMTGSGGAGGPYTFSATGLPAGLTMAPDGTISGTPTVSGTFNYTVTITDKDGNVGTINCSVTVQPPPQICTDILAINYGGPLPCVFPPPCPAGSFTFSMQGNGDLFIKYDQFPAPNDNSYGANAVGWPNGHKFSDLVGSDHAGFQLLDATNTVKLSFNVDYISANTSAPSGYASLGVLGGDGKMIVGTSTGISATSSLANNLNNINIPGLFSATHVQQFGSVNLLVDSPPTDPAHQTYVISDPLLTGWDFHDTYFVTISAAKLTSIGFNPATWKVEPNPDQLHNSPAKACPAGGGGGTCALDRTKIEVKGREVKVTIANNGSSDVFLSDLLLNWPSATNGKLMQVKLDGDIVYDNPDIAGGSAHLTLAELASDPNKRKITKNSSDVLTFVFEKNADLVLANYSSALMFGNCPIVALP